MMAENYLVERAATYAALKHDGQHRKYTGEPYVNHCAAVVSILRTVTTDETMLAAAWLHDVVEDCDVPIETIVSLFGFPVADLVYWLTNVSKPEEGNRETRKRLDREHTAGAPAKAKTIKLADLIHNLSSIVEHDRTFAAVYLMEKKELLPFLMDGDTNLWQTAFELTQRGIKEIFA
jgi:guanosine-3',5'-bis(diphosphate) 3'-pyrophosphohydrolase